MISSGTILLLSILVGLFSRALPAAETAHTVVRGDTIFSLSRSHGVSQEELMRRNGLTDPSQLQIGMRLFIPSAAARQPPAANIQAEHMVSPGETLFSIAQGRGITVQALREANGFTPNRVLRAGERIRIPLPQAAARPGGPPIAAQPAPGRRADPSLGWPIRSTEIFYMEGNLGGVIIRGRESESVRSISRGTVVHAGPWRGYGNVVVVESSGGFRLLYGANESLSVRVGDRVEPGTEVGKLGINPASGRSELVFIVLRNGIPVDPAIAPRS